MLTGVRPAHADGRRAALIPHKQGLENSEGVAGLHQLQHRLRKHLGLFLRQVVTGARHDAVRSGTCEAVRGRRRLCRGANAIIGPVKRDAGYAPPPRQPLRRIVLPARDHTGS